MSRSLMNNFFGAQRREAEVMGGSSRGGVLSSQAGPPPRRQPTVEDEAVPERALNEQSPQPPVPTSDTPSMGRAAPLSAGHVPAPMPTPTPMPVPGGRPEVVGRAAPAPKVVSAPSQIPGYNPETAKVLTAPGEIFALNDDDRRVLIALDISGRVSVIWTGRGEDARTWSSLKTRLQRANFTIASEFEADRALISTLYEPAVGVSRTQSVGVESVIDDEINRLCADAYLKRASDIHMSVEPGVKTEVEFRIDGDIVPYVSKNGKWGDDISRAIFTRGDADTKNVTFNSREPQGLTFSRRIRILNKVDPVDLRLRYQSSPTYPSGYDVVMRVLNMGTDAIMADLGALGFSEAQVRGMLNALDLVIGLNVLIGATGSGKSTTIKSMVDYLDQLHAGKRKIRSIEDPPEYRLRARQHPVVIPESGEGTDQSRASQAFLKALRAAMRQDPDAIVIGEIRDTASAELAMQAALTGHQVLTTFHAADIFACMRRFRGLGIPVDVMGGEGFLQSVISQRLVKVLCPHCSVPYARAQCPSGMSPTRWAEIKERIERFTDTTRVRVRGPGCEKCSDGLKGRTVVAEIFIPDWRMQDLITRDKIDLLAHYWRVGRLIDPRLATVATGFTMREHVLAKIQAGQVCPIEAEKDTGPLGRNLGADMLTASLDLLRRHDVITEEEHRSGREAAIAQPLYPGIGPGTVSA